MKIIEHQNKDDISILKINREKQLNSLNKQVINDLSDNLKELNKDHKVRCVIITGCGDKAFAAGADIKEFYNHTTKEGSGMSKKNQAILFDFIENMQKPVIAMVNGYALGGGLELAMSCHIRTGSSKSIYGFPEVKLGLIPGYGGTQRAARIVGLGKAFEMILSAKMIDAKEAHRINLINAVYDEENLYKKTIDLAKTISKNSPQAISKAIKTINSGYYNKGFEEEIQQFGKCFQTTDFKEGVGAFLEKRKPNFK